MISVLRDSGRTGGALVVVATLGGFAEAVALVVIVEVGLRVGGADTAGSVAIGPLSLLEGTTTTQALAAGAALIVLRLSLQLLAASMAAHIAGRKLTQLRVDLFAAYSRAAWARRSQSSAGELQDYLTTNVGNAATAALTVALGATWAASLVALLVASFAVSVVVSVALLAAVLVLFFAFRGLADIARRNSREQASRYREYVELAVEASTLGRELSVYGVMDEVRSELAVRADRVRRPYQRKHLLSKSLPALYQAAGLLLIVGALGVLDAVVNAEVAELGAAVALLVRALSYGQSAQAAYQQASEQIPYLEEVDSIISSYAQEREVSGDILVPGAHIGLHLEDVTYRYPGAPAPALHGISFEIPAKQMVGIVGPSGAGKSTLIDLVLGLRTPLSGQLLVNGVALGSLDAEAWRRRIAYVPQESELLTGSVLENVRLFREWISEEDVELALSAVGLDRDVAELPQGLHTVVGRSARNLSGGQRQRISLARALAGRPALLVLDEPTSALDAESEARVAGVLNDLMADVTIVVVAHRLATVASCDLIVVVEAGCVTAYGSPADVSQRSKYYVGSETDGHGGQ